MNPDPFRLIERWPEHWLNLIKNNLDILDFIFTESIKNRKPPTFKRVEVEFKNKFEILEILATKGLLLKESEYPQTVGLAFFGFIFCPNVIAKDMVQKADLAYTYLRQKHIDSGGESNTSLDELIEKIYASDEKNSHWKLNEALMYFRSAPLNPFTYRITTTTPTNGEKQNIISSIETEGRILKYPTFEDYIRECILILTNRPSNAPSGRLKLESLFDKSRESQVTRGSNLADLSNISKIWIAIEKDYDTSKKAFGKKMSFVKDEFKRKVLFRDVAYAYSLANAGFAKPALILAGSVIEELLRIYLKSQDIVPESNRFDSYIKECEKRRLLKSAVHRLTDSVRHFRNLVHLENESSLRHSISKAIAKGAVASIFTIVNDF